MKTLFSNMTDRNIRQRVRGSYLSGMYFSLLVLVLGGVLQGCSVAQSVVNFLTPTNGPVQLRRLALIADKQSNAGSPVAVDVVIIHDKKAFEILSNLRAVEWFNAKQDFVRQYQQRLVVHSWEIVPGQTLEAKAIDSTYDGLVGTLVFANYAGDKAFRADATGMPGIQVLLGGDDFLVKAL